MTQRPNTDWRRTARRLLAGTVLAAGVLAAPPCGERRNHRDVQLRRADLLGDGADNSIVISRDAAGKILVNDGAVTVAGDPPTVGTTAQVRLFAFDGQDAVRLDEANCALPAARLSGGAGNDA